MSERRVFRILYHHRTQALDGQRVHIREIQDALRQLGHQVVEVAPIRATEVAGDTVRLTWRRRTLATLARIAPRGVYELLELCYNLPGFVQLSSAIRKQRPDFIYERYSLNTVAGVWAAAKFRLPLLLEVNSPLALEKQLNRQLGFYRMSCWLERYVVRGATRVLTVSEVLRDLILGTTEVSQERVAVIRNGADLGVFENQVAARAEQREALGLESEVVIGAVAFFREWHGIDRLLECLHRNDDMRQRVCLLLIGDGPALPELKETTSRLGLERRVTFCGATRHDQVPDLIAAMDVAVLPRAVEYASPLKLFEYMAAGKAILAPRQENLLEVLTEGVDALCFADDDTEEFSTALHRLSGDPLLRERLGQAARQTIQRLGLTWEDSAKRIIRVFEECRAGDSANSNSGTSRT